MAKGTKKQSGPTRARTVMKLLPIRYKITLSYMGHERIQRDGNTYRCRYTVETGATPGGAALDAHDPTRLPNLLPPKPLDPAGKDSVKDPNVWARQVADRQAIIDAVEKAAKPSAKGGDSTNPPPAYERIYRVMIVDNHGMRSMDEQDTQHYGLLGRGGAPDGDTESKPANYTNTSGGRIDWMPDVKPAVPFRIVVRKYIGSTQVDLDKDLKTIVEIKDPVEEFEPDDPSIPDNDARKNLRRKFLVEFFKKYNRNTGTATAGDDNCPAIFMGHRAHGGGAKTGVKATDVLHTVVYKSLPVVDLPPSPTTATVPFTDLGAATANGDMNAEFAVKRDVEEQVGKAKFKVGVVDFAFRPRHPVGGDNYRFLVSLADGSGKDIRETKENGREVELLGLNGEVIPKPLAYATGRFILWKRMFIKLVVLVNDASREAIDWGFIQGVYRKSFLDVVPPSSGDGYRTLVAARWIDELKAVFTSGPDQAALEAIKTAAAPNDLATVYRQYFYPKCLTDKYVDDPPAGGGKVLTGANKGLCDTIEVLARNIITHTCAAMNPPLESPDSANGKKQKEPDGSYIMLIRAPSPTDTTLGVSFGDRMFWFVNRRPSPTATTPEQIEADRRDAIGNTTSTCAHEMGHSLYLRHSHTSYSTRAKYRVMGHAAHPAAAPTIQLVDGSIGNAIQDHDQEDALACLMGYTRHLQSEPCALCRLALRFYDRVAIQRNANYRDQILSGLAPVTIVRAQVLGGALDLSEAFPATLGAGATWYAAALGPEKAFRNRSGQNLKGRVNITTAHDTPVPSLWSAAPAGKVTLAIAGGYLKITRASGGNVNVTVTYRNGSLTASITFRVV